MDNNISRPLRVLSVNNAYYIRGGADRYFFELNNLLVSAGDEVIPFSVKNERNFPTRFERYFLDPVDFSGKKNIFNYSRLAIRGLYSWEAKRKLDALIKNTKPQLAHLVLIHNSISGSILPLLKKYRIPVVFTLLNFDPICPSYHLFSGGKICRSCKDGFYLRAAFKRCHKGSFHSSLLLAVKAYIYRFTKLYERFIDIFIVPSRFLEEIFAEHGINKERLVYLPGFLNTDDFRPSYEDSDYFVYFGNIFEGKGLRTLLQSMESVRNAKLYIVGDGPLKTYCEKFTEERKLKNVKFLGFRKGEELKDIVRGAMFSVFPSELYETFGYSIVESFALGKAVVGSRLGSRREIIDDSVNGLLFNTADARDLSDKIQYLIDNPSLRLQMGRNARRKAEEQYSAKVNYEKLRGLYLSLLRGRAYAQET